jgi:hypothetical protein
MILLILTAVLTAATANSEMFVIVQCHVESNAVPVLNVTSIVAALSKTYASPSLKLHMSVMDALKRCSAG